MIEAFPGVVIAGASSSCGKTTAAIGLISALRKRGLAIQPAKAGPDFLDAAWLAKAAGRQCLNLDAWMAPQNEVRKLMAQWPQPYDLLALEGVMGLYDGAADNTASTAQLAAMLNLPVLLLINAKGMGQSIAALASGFLAWGQSNQKKPPRFCGIICTHVGSERHQRLLADALASVCADFSVPLLGCLPCQYAPQIPARHLGLAQACELDLDFETAGRWFAANVDLDALLKKLMPASVNLANEADGQTKKVGWTAQESNFAAKSAPAAQAAGGKSFRGVGGLGEGGSFAKGPPSPRKKTGASPCPIVAIARDEAFSFCYADLPSLLTGSGAQVAYFSPLRDSSPPLCDAVYLPGGYPELYARGLAANAGMIAGLRALAREGTPIYGECGGYMYLLEAIINKDGEAWPMAAILPGRARIGKHLAALGYRAASPCWLGEKFVYGHEFHYARAEGEACPPLWLARNALGEDAGPNGQRLGNAAGSWIHLYPAGSKAFWRQWLKLAAGMEKSGDWREGK